MASEQFAKNFDVLSRSDWEELASAGLHGRSLDSLTTITADGIELVPVHGPDTCDVSGDPAGLPGFGDRTRGSLASGNLAGGWDIRALVADNGPEAANASVLDELLRGSTSFLLDSKAVGIASADDLARTLDGVHLDMTTVALLPGPDTPAVAAWLLDHWEADGIAPADRRGVLGLDPLGVAARHGGALSWDAAMDLVDRCRDLPHVRPLVVDATPYADAGATDARQLGWVTASGVEALRALVDHGLSVEDAFDQISFTLSADTDQFATIARMRAARRLWARVAEVSDASEDRRGQVQHAMTSAADLTQRDPWVNLLRGTVAAFAAGVGGAGSVTVRPFDSAIGRSDEFGRRTARNTQLLLLEEASLAAVVDPVGGSWYVEHFTDRLAEEGWTHFQNVESDGGMSVAQASGRIAAEVATCWEARRARLATRTEPITGVSVFPNLDEERPVRDPASSAPAGPLSLLRRAEAFESLRDATDAAGGGTVGMTALGPQADHTARTTFAANLYAVAGLRTVDVEPGTATDLPAVVVICGSDDRYATDGVDAVSALRTAGVARIHLAGSASTLDHDLATALQEVGVDEFVHARSDVEDLLARTLSDLGIVYPVSAVPTGATG